MNFGKTLFENSIANSIQEDTYEILITMQKILRLLQLNLFEKRDLMALLRGIPKTVITRLIFRCLYFGS